MSMRDERRAAAMEQVRKAWSAGARGPADIAALLDIPLSTAVARLAQARRAGLVPPADRHRPGLPLRGAALTDARLRMTNPALAAARQAAVLARGKVRAAEAAVDLAADVLRERRATRRRWVAAERRLERRVARLERAAAQETTEQ